jgi:16S rRNA (guanine966-N2)-methyltransferase
MRIISGNFKGKKIHQPLDKNTRPLRDMVKESIFNLLVHSKKINFEIINSNILDLFSGSGSFGLECVSRGANQVIFVENYFNILNILKQNVKSIDTENICKIVEKDCFDYFKINTYFENKVDLIFIDPPYKEKKINFLIDEIKKNKILDNNGIIIIHRHKRDDIKISKKLRIIDQRTYGISKIIIGN